MKWVPIVVAAVFGGGVLQAQRAAPASSSDTLPLRHRPVANRLPIDMGELAGIRVEPAFSYVGGQRFILGGAADAEQHLFVVADSSKSVQRLYWIQIESLRANRPGSYDYSADTTAMIQGVPLAANSRVYTTRPDPSSDRARAFGLVEALGFRIPDGAARVRFIYLPEQPARREVMIIHVEPDPGAAADVAARLTRAASGIRLERARR